MSVKLVNCVAKFLCEFICSSTWKFVNASASILPILETLCTKITTSLMIEESVIIMFSVYSFVFWILLIKKKKF